jgi:hypothetical protein
VDELCVESEAASIVLLLLVALSSFPLPFSTLSFVSTVLRLLVARVWHGRE